jgi:hypothetical protein
MDPTELVDVPLGTAFLWNGSIVIRDPGGSRQTVAPREWRVLQDVTVLCSPMRSHRSASQLGEYGLRVPVTAVRSPNRTSSR